ncbi:hypothetical protein BN873_360069 [Candidatus Competibacter denitrificans Run_A_D11]|uniref:Uncharacterized protein n=1 Tax=Candidatus Competibacter denitrificans Run_A_D11 TaxID=1400863 RepID=W6MAJ2_9GAMM|nr:hypothetical protein BN873_360069 [Candidatus Competibacter denitrificans Run_A_D11]
MAIPIAKRVLRECLYIRALKSIQSIDLKNKNTLLQATESFGGLFFNTKYGMKFSSFCSVNTLCYRIKLQQCGNYTDCDSPPSLGQARQSARLLHSFGDSCIINLPVVESA